MLHFLRNIRRKLIIQDNARKYIVYAVGETALVMIGILLALQVNNWNEEREEAKLKDWYIRAITAEVNNNLQTMVEMDSLASLDTLETKLQIAHLKKYDGNVDTLKTVLKNFRARVIVFREVTSPSLESLLNSGDIDLFDEQSRERIIQLKTTTNTYLKINELGFEIFSKAYSKYNDKLGFNDQEGNIGKVFSQMVWDNIDPIELITITNNIILTKFNFQMVGFSIRDDYRVAAEAFKQSMED